MKQPNHVTNFASLMFAIYGYCGECGYSEQLDYAQFDMAVPRLIESLRYREFGSRDCSIKIVFTEAGPYQ